VSSLHDSGTLPPEPFTPTQYDANVGAYARSFENGLVHDPLWRRQRAPRRTRRATAVLLLALSGALPWGGSDAIAEERSIVVVEPRSYGTTRESEPPRYVRTLERIDPKLFPGEDWLELGLDYRVRFELRDNDFRRTTDELDLPILLRTRAYVGVKRRFDPLRFYVEFEDARREHGDFPRDDRDVNEAEFIQAVAELHFADALGAARPLRLQGGRFAFEYLDRRLIARNEWRNTTNTFQGSRAILGQRSNDWQLDLIAVQPLERRIFAPDRTRTDQWFFAVVGDGRRWSEIATLQPYYLGLEQNRSRGKKASTMNRSIHSAGLRAYGIVGTSGFDWDFDVVVQRGRNGSEAHRAFGFTTEIGRTFEHPWKPRTSLNYGYGSGDRDPEDGTNQRFERYFGFARPWSNNDYFQWENLSAPKVRVELRPTAEWRVDFGHGAYWLASSSDRWNNTGLRDPTGRSGDFIGHEFDIRSRYRVTPRIDTNVGYAHFVPGEFTRNVGRSNDSNFFYVEISISAFE
jgi:hypothetical protein